MTQEEFDDKIHEILVRKEVLHNRTLSHVRPIVDVLLDAGRANSAKPLQEILFEFDLLEQEMKDLIVQNKGLLFERLFSGLRRRDG